MTGNLGRMNKSARWLARTKAVRYLRGRYRGVWLAGILGSVVILLIIAITLKLEREQIFQHSEKQAGNLALIVQKDIARNFEIYGLSLQAMVDGWNDPELENFNEEMRRRVIFDRSSNAANITSAFLLDADGKVSLDLRHRNIIGQKFADRDFFDVHRNSAAVGLYLSGPFISRVSGATNVALSRRINDKDGSFAGVAVLTLNVEYFRELLSGLDLGRQGRASLVSGSGIVLMSYPYEAKAVGKNGAETEVYKKSLVSASSSFISRSLVDDHQRFFVVDTVRDPVVKVMIGFSTDDIYADWKSQAWPTAGASLIFAFLLIFASAMLSRQLQARKLAEDRLQLLANTDSLTGLSTRRALDQVLDQETRRLNRSNNALSLIFIDVDYFKKYNDTYGHPAGDKVLAKVAEVISMALHRVGDHAGRYGGEEFLIVLAQTELAGAVRLAESIRRTVEALNIPHEESIFRKLTISVGVVASAAATGNSHDLVQAADEALYKAKKDGRNRVHAIASRD